MIKSKKELDFYIKADKIMNGLSLRRSFNGLIIGALTGAGIAAYLKAMRCFRTIRRKQGYSPLLKDITMGSVSESLDANCHFR